MGPTGRLVTIKRSGVDGPHFPLSLSTCLFGRGIECDIRIQLPVVSKQHCKIEISGQEAVLFNFSSSNPTQVNGCAIDEPVQLKHGDVITIVDRSFRYENEIHQNGSKSTECLGRKRKQESLLRVSRSSFSSDPDGKVQDPSARSKVSEDVSGSPLVHVKNGKAASTVLDGSGDHVASQTLDVVHSSEPPGENYRNVTDPTARDYQEDSSVPLVSCNRKLKSFPSTRCLENSENHESPFRKLYVSMKEEFDVRSEKGNVPQGSKKSGSQSHPAPENECSGGLQEGTQVPVSLKSRPRSGRFTQIKADSALGKQGISQTEDRRNDEDAAQNPKEAMSPSKPPKDMTRAKTLAQRSPHSSSRKRRSEDMSVTSGSESMNLDQREGFGTENETFTPRKFLARNQTPAKVENADNFEDTPEKLFSKKRSVPPSVDILTAETETQNHTILAPLPVQVERKIQGVSVHQPEKVGATAGHTCSGLPGHSSVDTSNFGDSNNKIEGIPLKRRRVSFGGRLKPELFDENLPPNTPLKRGETPRRSLVSHTPPVLKKIIKECPPPSGKEDSSENQLEVTAQPQRKGSPACDPTQTSPVATDTRRRSCKAASVPGRSKSPHHTDIPKRGGRRSGNLPSKKTSIDRSQHEILQMIYSRRRSGASEANLIVAKSWADVVKLGAKQTQAKVVKHGPQRQLNKRQRRMNTPKKPVSNVHNQFSTGHANSPCTIIIGKAHVEKVNVPTRPYRMLNNFVFNKKMDFNEDLSGLTEMFKTPAKVKLQTMSLCPKTFSNSGDLLGKEFQVPNSGEKPLLCTSEDLGENVFSMSQNALQEPSNQSPASPALRRQAIGVNTNIEKTPGSGAEPRKSASNENRLRRSEELRNTRMPGVGPKDGEAETDIAESTSGRRLTKTPQRGRNLEGAAEEWESYSEACTKAVQSEENSAKMVAVRRSRRYSEQKWEPVADLTTLTGWEDPEPKKDLRGIHGLQTPTHTQEPMDVGNKTAEKCQKSSKPEVAGMPTRMSIQLKTSPQRVEREEEPSALRKPTRTPRESTHTHRESGGGDEDIKLFKETPKCKRDSAEDITRSKRRSRTSKKTAQSLEDLADLRELFQTPNHKDKSMADGKATKVPCRSPLAEPVNTPTSRRRQLETPLQKVDLEEEPSALRKPTQTPRESTPSHREPGNGDEGIKLFKETPKQKLDSAAYVTGSKKRSRTPKKMVHSPEDVVGLKELFQTPEHTQYPMADDKTTKVPCKSPLAEPVNTPTSGRRQIKTPLQKVDPEEEPSALRKPTQTPRESTHSHGEPGGDDEGIKLFNQTPKQKLDFAEIVTGSKRRSRTPKKNIQSLEDLAGLRELFKTPNQTEKPMTDDKTTRVPCKSPLTDPVNTPTIRKRQIKTPLQKVGLEEEPSAFRKPTQTPRESTHSHREPGDGDDEDITLFNQTPKQKLDFAEIVTGSKRRSRTPKKTAQSLEDLVGLRELLQTPNQTEKPMADDKTTKVPCKSPRADPVNTPTIRKRQIKTPLQKVGLQEKPSALRKPTQMLGESTHSHKEPGGDDEGIKKFKDTPKQKLNSAENVTGSKRKKRSRTPKKSIQSLEDLAGLRELFKTPNQTEKPMADDKTTKVPCKSPRADPVNTPTIRKRQIKTPLQKVGLEEEPSAFRKPTQTPRESTHSHREPGDGDDEDIKLFNQTPKQKLDFAEIVTGSKRRSRTPKKTAQFLEDLVGLRELLQTPNQTDKPVADDKTTKVPCRSPLADPVNTPSRRRQIKTPLQKVGLEEEPSALRKPTQMLGESTHSHKEPGGDDEGIKRFKDTPKQKLNSAENVTGSKRKKRSRTPKKSIQSLEDLAGLRELFKTPNQTEKPMTDDKTTKVPCKSPLADPVNTPTIRKRQIKTPLQKVGLEEEPSAFRKPTQTPRESTHSHREPGDGDDEDIKLFNQTPKQKLDFAEIVTGSKKRSRTPKKTAQSLEDLVGLRELLQTPNQTDKPVADDKTTKVPCRSPLAEPVNTPSRRQIKTPLQKADPEEEPSALRKPTQMLGENTHSHKEAGGDDECIKRFKDTPKQKLHSAENVTRSKRRSRTPKKNIQSLEDLAGITELFQTPEHTQDPMTDGKTTNIPCKSPLAEPVNTPTSRRRQLEIPLQKLDLEEEPSALRRPTQTPRESTHSHREPGGDDEGIKLFNQTPKQKLDSAENVTGSKKRSRTPKKSIQSLEDLAGLGELLQTPNQTDKAMADGQATSVPCKSPLAEPVNTPTSRRRQLEFPLQKLDLEEEPSALRKPTQTPRESTPSHRKPGGDDKDSELFNQTPKQKLNSAENVTGSKKRSRTPKKDTQSLEDLAGLRELFQTPEHSQDPMADGKTTSEPCRSPVPDSVTPTIRRRQLETPLQEVDLEEKPSSLRKPTQMLGESTHSRRELGGGDDDIKLSKETPKKLDPVENVTRSKEGKAQFLEDMVGFKELFQTPELSKEPTAIVKATIMPCKSPPAETGSTPTHMKRYLQIPLGKEDLKKELSPVRKPILMPGEATHREQDPGGDDKDIRLFKKTPKQKLNLAENAPGSKKQPRTPKKMTHSLEDLVGLKELFQTPEHTQDPMADDKTTKMPCKSPVTEPVNKPTGRRRQLNTFPQKVDVEEEPSALRKPTRTRRGATHSHTQPGGGDEDTKLSRAIPKQKLDSAENVTGSKRQPRAPKKNVQTLEDLAGLRELQTPEHTHDPMADGKATSVPRKSPVAEPVNKPTGRRRQLNTFPQKVDVEEEPSALRKPTRTRRGATHSHTQPGGGDEDTKLSTAIPKQKLDSAENVTGSKRQPRAPKKNVQNLEDLAGLRELQTPEHTQDPMADGKATSVPCKSPVAEPVKKPTGKRRCLKTSPEKVDPEEEPSALRKPTRTRRGATHSHTEPGGGDEDNKLLNKTTKQKAAPAENVMLRKNRLRAPKEKSQAPEDLAGSKESSQMPGHTKGLGEEASSIQETPKQTPDRRKPVKVLQRGVRAPRGKAVDDLVGQRDPLVESGSEGSVSLSSKRKQGMDGGQTGMKRLRSATSAQDTAEEKPPQKRRRTAPREGCDPPEQPLTVKKKLRVVAEKIEVMGDLPRSHRKAEAKGQEVGRTTPPHQGRSLRSRRPNKTEVEEQRPEPVTAAAAAEKMKTKRSDKKPLKTSQETRPQSPEDRAKSSASAGKAPRESRMCLRSARPSKMPSPDVAEEKQGERRGGALVKEQEEDVRQPSAPKHLRSRKITDPPGGNALESEPRHRVTRSAKRCAEDTKEDNDHARPKRLRTRSRRDNEDI